MYYIVVVSLSWLFLRLHYSFSFKVCSGKLSLFLWSGLIRIEFKYCSVKRHPTIQAYKDLTQLPNGESCVCICICIHPKCDSLMVTSVFLKIVFTWWLLTYYILLVGISVNKSICIYQPKWICVFYLFNHSQSNNVLKRSWNRHIFSKGK